jgi:hypothetical protein
MNELGLIDANGLIAALNSMGGIGDFNDGNLARFQKALTATSGYTGYNLEREVKFRLPAYTVLRQRVAVDPGPVGPMAGPQAHWKMQLGYNGFDFGAAMGTAFGGNGQDGDPNATDIGADYKSQSIHGAVQLEAIDFGRQFTDPIKAQSMFNLQTLMRIEELLVTGGNEIAISGPTVTGSGLGTGSVFHAGTWRVKVTALTLEGTLRNATGAAANAGTLPAVKYPGESVVGTANITVGGTGLYIDVSWPVVEGALGYKVYCSSAYNDTTDVFLVDPTTEMTFKDGDAIVPQFTGGKYVGVNHVHITHAPAGSTPPPTVDGSANANTFEGYWAWATKTTMYSQSLTGAGQRVFYDMDGAEFSAEDSGVAEINDCLEKLALLYHTAPTAMVGSPKTIRAITNVSTSNNSTNMMLVGNQGGNLQQQNKVIGGLMIGGYTNQFAQHYGMSPMIDIIAHPYMPDGSLMLLSETLPPDTYRFAQDSRCFALDVLRPYNYFPLASVDRNINFDIWFLETLKCYYPTSQAAIAGIDVSA